MPRYRPPLYNIVHKFGRNPDNDTTTGLGEDVWGPMGTITWQTAAQTATATITGASAANDDGNPAGSGAHTLTIQGLDASWNEVEETITLNGASAVITTQTFLRIFRAWVPAAGTTGWNEGLITITYTTSGDDAVAIQIGEGQTQFAAYTIPAGKLGFVRSAFMSLDASKAATFKFWRRDGKSATPSHRLQLFFDAIGAPTGFKPDTPLGPYPAGTDLWWSAIPAAQNTAMMVDFEIWLIDDDGSYYPSPWPTDATM